MNEVKTLLKSLKYGSSNILKEEDEYVLTRPLNSYDTNYTLYDNKKRVRYLVDIEDVESRIELLAMDIEDIKGLAWRILQQ